MKQKPSWSVTLEPDGVVVWTTPTGHIRTTTAIDHLRRATLPTNTDPRDTDPENNTGPKNNAGAKITGPEQTRFRPQSAVIPDDQLPYADQPGQTLLELALAHQLELAGIHRIDRHEPPAEPITHDLHDLRRHHIRIDPALFKATKKDTDPDPPYEP